MRAPFVQSRMELAWVPLVLAALLVIYLPGLGNPPIFDDDILTNGRVFENYGSLSEAQPRMLSYGSFVWVQSLFGEGWWKQRLVNLAIHFAVVASLWALYRELLRSIVATPSDDPAVTPVPWESSPALGLAIGFFALNPVAVYAVGYLVQRSILLATLFVVLALWLFARALRQGKPWLYAAAVLAYALAVMSKEHAILAPLAAVPIYILVARPSAKRLAVLALAGATLIGIVSVFLLRRYGEILGKPFDEFSQVYLAQLGQINPDALRNAFPLSILNQAYLFFEYGLRWFFPASGWMSINLRPPFPLSYLSFPHVLGAAGYLATVAGGFFLLLRYRDWRALLALGFLVPALLFATEFATVWVQDPFVLYRSYLWAIGVPALILVAFHGTPSRIVLAIGVAVGLLLAWQALDRVLSLASPQAAWTDAIRKLPSDPRAVGRWFPYLNRGSVYAERDQFNLALKDFEASAALGDMGMGSLNTGSILSAQGKHEQALQYFDRAEKEGYKLYNLYAQRGLALAALGRMKDAFAQFQTALGLNPPSPTREVVLLNYGRIALQLGAIDEAKSALEGLFYEQPAHREGRYLLGMTYVNRHDYARALEILDTLVRDDPNGRSYYARALAHYGLKRKAEALSDIDNAIRIGPDNPHLREWKARIQAMP